MPRAKKITVTEAIEYAKENSITLSRPTVVKYAQKYGHQLGGKGGKWVINKDKFKRWLDGEI